MADNHVMSIRVDTSSDDAALKDVLLRIQDLEAKAKAAAEGLDKMNAAATKNAKSLVDMAPKTTSAMEGTAKATEHLAEEVAAVTTETKKVIPVTKEYQKVTAASDKTIKDFTKNLKEFLDKNKDVADSMEKYGSTVSTAEFETEELADTSDDLTGNMDGLGDTLKKVGKYLIGLFAFAKVAGFIKDAALEAIAAERKLNQLGNAVRLYDKENEASLPNLDKFVKGMRDQGLSMDESREALLDILPVAKSADNAMRAVSLAYDIAQATGKDFSSVMSSLQRIMTGSTQPVDDVRAAFYGMGIEAEDADGILRELFQRFGGYNALLDDHQKALDTATSKWAAFKEAAGEWAVYAGDQLSYGFRRIAGWLGETFVPIGARLDRLRENAEGYAKLINSNEGVIAGLLERRIDLETQLANRTQTPGILLPQIQEVNDKISEASAKLNDLYTVYQSIQSAIAGYEGKKPPGAATTPEGAPVATGEDPAKAREREAAASRARSEALRAEEARTRALANATDILAREFMALARGRMTDAESALSAAKTEEEITAALRDAIDARDALYTFEQKQIEVSTQREMDAAKDSAEAREMIANAHHLKMVNAEAKFQADLLKIQSKGQDLSEKLQIEDLKIKEGYVNDMLRLVERRVRAQRKYDEKFGKDSLKGLDSEHTKKLKEQKKYNLEMAALYREGSARRAAYESAAATLETDIAKSAAVDKVNFYLWAASTMMEAAQVAFGKNKGLAIAQTIISTWLMAQQGAQSAMEALPWPYNMVAAVATAALALAQGYARVKAIQNAEPEGFAVGTPMITRTGTAVVHKGEAIMTAQAAGVWRQQHTDSIINNNNNNQRGPISTYNVSSIVGSRAFHEVRDLDKLMRGPARANRRLEMGNPHQTVGSRRKR